MSPRVSLPPAIEHALLGFLHQRPMHGYEIHQQLSEARGLGLVWRVKQSQLYAFLGKLEQKGYVTITLEPQEARPPRKIFQLTERGRETFLRWVQSPVQQGRKLRLEFLAKLYFAQQEGPEVVQNLIRVQRLACHNWLETQQAETATLKDEDRFDRLVHQFRSGQIEAMLTWLDSCQETLVKPVDQPSA